MCVYGLPPVRSVPSRRPPLPPPPPPPVPCATPPSPFTESAPPPLRTLQGGVEKYLVKVGDAIAAGDRIAEVSTDKATVDFDVVDDGIVAKFLIPEGTQDVAARTSLPAPAVIAPSP